MPNPAARFDEIYDATHHAVRVFITAKCANTADIHDIFQETYMELYNLLLKRGVNYVTYEQALVIRIAKRKLAKYYSLTARIRNFISTTNKNKDEASVDFTEKEADAFSLADFVVDDLVYENLRKIIRAKPDTVRKIFYLKYDSGLTITEIAQQLGLSESNVKNKLYRTLKELRETAESTL